MPNQPPSTRHRCQICHRQYKRYEHLKRHLSSHWDGKAHSCHDCGRDFARSDALKRHSKTCPSQHAGTQKSSKRRACDRCVKLKKACDALTPCHTCSSRSAICTYSVDEKSEPAAASMWQNTDLWPSELFIDTPWMDAGSDFMDLANASWNDFLSLNPNTFSVTNKPNLTFLDNFTRNAGLVKSFDCGTLELRQMSYNHAEQEAILQTNGLLLTDPFATICTEIVALIGEVATIKPRNSAVDITWSAATQAFCSEFFSPLEVRKKIMLYWSIWHPNVNILHPPTFNVIYAKPALIAAMAVIGAAVSPSESDRNNARLWFNAIEEVVFIDDDFCAEEFTDSFPKLSKIQALQAAYIVCLYQNWEGSDKAKGRIRRYRFSTLVSVARDIGIQKARHPNYTNLAHFDWLSFASREQLVRVFQWIFLIDTAFVIFNNLPPRMVIKELTCDLAISEAIFQAESAELCYELICQKAGRAFPESTSSRVDLWQNAESLCHDELSEQTVDKLASAGPLNLFTITSSMHSMLFQYQNSFNSQGQLVPLRNALENWKTVWTRYMERYAETIDHAPLGTTMLTANNMWKRIGFMRYASEYWLLASLLLDRICVAEQQNTGSAHDGQEGLLEQSESEAMQPILRKYDETSMQQVNDLIAGFQNASIS